MGGCGLVEDVAWLGEDVGELGEDVSELGIYGWVS